MEEYGYMYCPYCGEEVLCSCEGNAVNYCPANGCSKVIKRGDYCSEHKNVCQISGCGVRTESEYCWQHQNKCFKYPCSQRISSYRDVCNNHLEHHRCDA